MRVVVTVCLLCSLLRPAAADAGDEPRPRWWFDAAVQHELALTQAQVQALQRTFERDLPERVRLRRELDRLDSTLQKLLERAEEDDRVVQRVSARLEQVRARRNVRRTMVLLEMYRILTQPQRLALSRLQAAGLGQGRDSIAAGARSAASGGARR